jgi:hypothetical protein
MNGDSTVTGDFDLEMHENLRDRVANETDSTLWTFKAYYRGADFYSRLDRYTDWAIFGVAGILTFALVWDRVPNMVLIGLAILTAVISGYRRMAEPGKRAEEYYRAAHAYQRLFDEFRDFIKLELADKQIGLESMKRRYEELSTRRKNLNEDMPDITSRWYDKLDESVYDEVGTTEEAKDRLASEAKISEPDEVDDEVKKVLTGEADLTEEAR